MAFPFLELKQLTVRLNGKNIIDHLNLTIQPGEQWAITGASGSGKTTLAHTLAGRHHYSGQIIFNNQTNTRPLTLVVEQQHRFKNRSNTSDFYYQQRYNASDAADTLTVAEVLYNDDAMHEEPAAGISIKSLAGLLRIEHVMHEPLIQLSNGENKRLQIAQALLKMPRLLILDNPYIGLDAGGRETLSDIINTLGKSGVNIILLTTGKEIPGCITHVATLKEGKLISTVERENFKADALPVADPFRINKPLLNAIHAPVESRFRFAVRMVDVNVRYGERDILKNIHWEVQKGERWSISGPNGAGKSTLLSLITGDNNKAYANEIYLFDQRRGSGESIWDIKRKIGYVSPELHLYFDYSATCSETIASGLFDTIGLFRPLHEQQRQQVAQWITLFHLEPVQNKLLSSLSLGEQRLVLLARALVKNPPLLILDEPCQGLDITQIQQFKQIINDICAIFETTLLYVSHYKDDIPECVTHFLRLEEGKAAFTQTVQPMPFLHE